MNDEFLKYLDNLDDEMDRMFDEPDRYATMLYRTVSCSRMKRRTK